MPTKKKSVSKRKQGKKSRAAGARFELKVRNEMENMGWIVSRWMNSVEQEKDGGIWRLAPTKPKFVFNPKIKKMIPLGIGTGFPDFICLKRDKKSHYEVIGLEVKRNGYLDPKERSMCHWLIENKIFSRILIAKLGDKRGEVEYFDFEKKHSNQ